MFKFQENPHASEPTSDIQHMDDPDWDEEVFAAKTLLRCGSIPTHDSSLVFGILWLQIGKYAEIFIKVQDIYTYVYIHIYIYMYMSAIKPGIFARYPSLVLFRDSSVVLAI